MKANANQILIPMDFSDQALIALDQSYNLASFYNAEITLLYVIEESGALSKIFAKSIDEAAIKKEIENKLHELAVDTEKKKKTKVNTIVAKGAVYEKILEVAEMLNAKMIIMGSQGTVGIRKRFIGSNALRVVREASCPVITIKGKHHREGCKNIVLPIDLSKETREKVSKAIELGKLYGSTIRVVSVLFTLDEFVVNRITRQMDQVKSFIQKADVKCTAEMIKAIKGEESLSQAIVDYSNKVDADLIMIMTQQESETTPLFVGSTAQGIINNSDVPVMSLVPTLKTMVSGFVPY
ncbi:MAG TPA: universal stress protein [Bacteroidia bacterium]|jgi:nucleotide-binding universal stress UspA family protein|nr:universal stress protein [Bacteroidia bacterium]